MKKQKYYAVKVGRNPGIYLSWEECEEQIKGFPGQKFKSFFDESEALKYLGDIEKKNENVTKNDTTRTQEEVDIIIKECLEDGRVVAFTDGGYRGTENVYGYGIYIIPPYGKNPIEICDIVRTERFQGSNNIGPEVMAVVNALDWALSNEYEKITIFYDYEGIGRWAKNEWNANSKIANWFVKKLKNTYNDLLDIEYIWVKGHNNIEYNEKADQLATQAMNKHVNPQIKLGRTYFTCRSVDEVQVESIINKLSDDPQIDVQLIEDECRKNWKLSKLTDKTSIIFYKKTRATVVQGKPNALFSLFISFYTELIPDFDLITAYSRMRQRRIDGNEIDSKVKELNLPYDFPVECIKLIKQSLSEYIALSTGRYSDVYDFGHYVFPACRALEGTLKYMFEKSGQHISSQNIGCYFGVDEEQEIYYLKGTRFDSSPYKSNIENGYNLYHAHRHRLGHFGELTIGNNSDSSTYMIEDKDEALGIIDEILDTIKFD